MKKIFILIISFAIYAADENYAPLNQDNFYRAAPPPSVESNQLHYTKEQLRQSFAEHIATLNNNINDLENDIRRLKIQAAEQNKLIALLLKHTHSYNLTTSMGGLGPKTHTSRPLEVPRTEILKPFQMQPAQSSVPIIQPLVKPQ
jgi:hypothetical protein